MASSRQPGRSRPASPIRGESAVTRGGRFPTRPIPRGIARRRRPQDFIAVYPAGSGAIAYRTCGHGTDEEGRPDEPFSVGSFLPTERGRTGGGRCRVEPPSDQTHTLGPCPLLEAPQTIVSARRVGALNSWGIEGGTDPLLSSPFQGPFQGPFKGGTRPRTARFVICRPKHPVATVPQTQMRLPCGRGGALEHRGTDRRRGPPRRSGSAGNRSPCKGDLAGSTQHERPRRLSATVASRTCPHRHGWRPHLACRHV